MTGNLNVICHIGFSSVSYNLFCYFSVVLLQKPTFYFILALIRVFTSSVFVNYHISSSSTECTFKLNCYLDQYLYQIPFMCPFQSLNIIAGKKCIINASYLCFLKFCCFVAKVVHTNLNYHKLMVYKDFFLSVYIKQNICTH